MTEGFDVQVGKGLLITPQADCKPLLEVVDDQHFPDIHPNCYGPAECTNLDKLRGGGSGTAVFATHHPKFGSIVMKHAGYKDSKEVFALAHISSELRRRGLGDASATASDMNRRIPLFVMAYLSCYHLRDRAQELWSQLTTVSYSPLGKRTISQTDSCSNENPSPVKVNDKKIPNIPLRANFSDPRVARRIRVRKHNDEESIEWSVGLTYVDIFIPYETIDGQKIVSDPTFLQRFAKEIGQQLVDNKWKLTLAQQRIGGSQAMNGADILAACTLKVPLLDTLVKEFTLVVQHLCDLTETQERMEGLSVAKQHFQMIDRATDVTMVSKELDGQLVRLRATETTKTKMACARESFEYTLDRIVSEVFGGDRRVRRLLIHFVVLQLLSDSAFCLKRWEAKGGGVKRYGERLKDSLEKWLWRCIWDQYVASHVLWSYFASD